VSLTESDLIALLEAIESLESKNELGLRAIASKYGREQVRILADCRALLWHIAGKPEFGRLPTGDDPMKPPFQGGTYPEDLPPPQ